MTKDKNIISVILRRRSVRKFTSSILKTADIRQVLEAGRWAPSGLNNQPWRFLVIKESARKNGLACFTESGGIIRSAPVVIAVFLDTQSSYHRDKDLMGIGACIQNMLLEAHALGLGACWLGEILNRKKAVSDYLGINKYLELTAVIALGYSDEKNLSGSRKSLRSLTLR